MTSANTGISIGVIAVGGLFIFGAVENVSPLAAILDLIHGNKPIPGPKDALMGETGKQFQDRIATYTPQNNPGNASAPVARPGSSSGGSSGAGTGSGAQPSTGNGSTVAPPGVHDSAATEAANQNLGQQMAAASPYNWTGAEWVAFNNIVMAESGWDSYARSTISTASGIAQKIDGWSSDYEPGNAAQQIAWMLSYIKSRYGDPITAWAFHLANNWY